MRYRGISLLSVVLFPILVFGQAKYRTDHGVLLPDAKYTPGVVAIHDVTQLCPTADTSARRHVTEATKKAVCKEYGIPSSKCNGKNIEIDHVISLELGGANDIKNLYPQPWMPRPGAHDKDQVENWTHKQVCEGLMSLPDAQQQIAKDWYVLYLKMKERKHGSVSRRTDSGIRLSISSDHHVRKERSDSAS